MFTASFGHIPQRLDLLFSQGQIRTRTPFESDWLADRAHAEGYYYPPLQHSVAENWDGTTTPIPRTERPPLLHGLPPTHDLVLWGYPPDDADVRGGLAGFIIHLLGMLTGHRTQFDGWWFDGRIPIRPQTDATPRSPRQLGQALEVAVARWLEMDDRDRLVLINALFMHNRAPMYEWPWERFLVQYQVFDALFKVASRSDGLRASRHSERFRVITERYGLFVDEDRIRRIVELRNDLVHEVVWAGVMPMTGGGADGFYSSLWLRGINQRLALSVFGFTGPYIRSSWLSRMTYLLDLDQLRRGHSA